MMGTTGTDAMINPYLAPYLKLLVVVEKQAYRY
jgi:hypothetical protein